MTKPATEKTTWLRMVSDPKSNEMISTAVLLWRSVNDPPDANGTQGQVLASICREWSDRERERIRRPEK